MVFAIFRVVYRGSNGKNPYERTTVMADLTRAEMRAIELMNEQQSRLNGVLTSAPATIPPDEVVQRFYENSFERTVLEKIGKLLVPGSTEDLNLTVRL
jgi:hypothetical protein